MRILIDLAIGLLIGRYLLPARWKRAVGVLQHAATLLALYFMGVSLGAQGELWQNLQQTGWMSFCIAIGTVGGSLLLTCAAERYLRRRAARKNGGKGAE